MLLLLGLSVAFAAKPSRPREVDLADFRTRDGACQGGIGAVKFCLRQGSLNTLGDDPATFMLITTFRSPTIDCADPSSYEIQVLKNGVEVLKTLGSPDVPEVGTAGFWDIDVFPLEGRPKSGDTYTLTATATWDTRMVVTKTFVVR